MLENQEHGKNIQNSFSINLRETWVKFQRSFFSSFRNILSRLQNLGRDGISGRLDEKLSSAVQKFNYMTYRPNQEDGKDSREKTISLNPNSTDTGFIGVGVGNSSGANVSNSFVDNNPLLKGLKYEDESTEMIGPTVPSSNDIPILVPTSINEVTKINKKEDPILTLLEKAKTSSTRLTLDFNVQLPNMDVLQMLFQNFPESKETISKFILEKINDSLMEEIQTNILKIPKENEELSNID